MAEVMVPTWNDLKELVNAAQDSLLICTPFYTEDGINNLFDYVRPASRLKVWTRLSPSDWASGAAAPESLLALLELLDQEGIEVELGIHQRLHAKAYAADRSMVLVGSANLSSGGFSGNIELMVKFQGEEAARAITVLEQACSGDMRSLTLPDLRTWIKESHQAVQEARKTLADNSGELSGPQAALDRLLGFGKGTKGELVTPTDDDRRDFGSWLEHNEDLAGAKVLIEHWTNSTRQNRQGHFRQSFYGISRFLSEYPQWRPALSRQLTNLAYDEVYQPSPPELMQDWLHHLNDHALDNGPEFSYPTLRNQLAPSMGGTRSGGGGAAGTTKRMFPLLARYLEEIHG